MSRRTNAVTAKAGLFGPDSPEGWAAYKAGSEACRRADSDTTRAENPYEAGGVEWQMWNRGWNSV